MALAVFQTIPWGGARFRDVWEGQEVLTEDGPGVERVVNGAVIPRRFYAWSWAKFPEEVALDQAFVVARNIVPEAFLLLDPWQNRREGVSLGLATAAVLTYSLPTSKLVEAYRSFPVPGTVTATVAGSPRQVASVDVDARTITLAGPNPAGGEAIVVAFTEYRCCRFAPDVVWGGEAADWYSANMEIREVFRP